MRKAEVEQRVALAIGEATAGAVPEFAFLELDRVRVQGKDVPVAIYEPLGLRGELNARTRRMREQHSAALEAYRRRDWDAAEQSFFSLHQSYPERRLFSIYLDWLPFIYRADIQATGLRWLWENLKQGVMPITVLGLFQGAQLTRFVRSAVLDVILARPSTERRP